MKISALQTVTPVLSFEVFPPKPTSDETSIYRALEELATLHPAFISVTFGAGGGANNQKTVEIATAIRTRYGIESVAHLPGINLSEEEAIRIIEDFRSNGIDNVLALRGDPVPDLRPSGRFRHADELISFIKSRGDFHIIAACYPEGHPESRDRFDDLRHLKQKVAAGVDRLITQLFLDNDTFYSFRDAAARRRIDVPIEAGIMPVTQVSQVDRMIRLSGIRLPEAFADGVLRFSSDPADFRAAGIEYANRQIDDLLSHGVDGIHLYTMNKPDVADAIVSSMHRYVPNSFREKPVCP